VVSGQLIADLVVDERLSVVLDLSRFRKGEQVRFMTDFAEQLYHRNRNPLHLVLDEADAFAPQRPLPGQQRMLGAVEDIVRRGRARGLGVSLVTQRSAVLNKDVLTQVEVLVALRTIAPQDRAAIDEWIKVHGTPEQREQLMSSLPSLPIGTAWVWSPGWLNLFKQVRIRKRGTFDSSATPDVGKKVQAPKKLADVDLEQLRGRLQATIERAKADNPKALRARITEFERQAATKPAAESVEVRVEVPVLDPRIDSEARAAVERIRKIAADVGAALKFMGQTADRLEGILEGVALTPPQSKPAAQPVPRIDPVPREHRRPPPSSPSPRPERAAAGAVRAPQQRILDALTDDGRGLATATDPIHSVAQLHEAWRAKLSAPQGRILTVLAELYPQPISREELADAAGQSSTSSGYANNLGSLRSLGLLDYPSSRMVVATDLLFPRLPRSAT
jgi:hypothetical protein